MSRFYSNPGAEDMVEYIMGDTSEAITQLNSFLRGEIAACETYRQAIDKIAASEPQSARLALLREMQKDHAVAAQNLRDRIQELGGEAVDSSGVWGAWATFTQGSADLFGDAASLRSLKEGEAHGLKDYERGIDDVDAESCDLIINQMIPAIERHIGLLDQLIPATMA